jgi:hypothetical protein
MVIRINLVLFGRGLIDLEAHIAGTTLSRRADIELRIYSGNYNNYFIFFFNFKPHFMRHYTRVICTTTSSTRELAEPKS